MELYLDLINLKCTIPSYVVYILDRRNWQNKLPKQPDHIPESKDDLRAIINNSFAKTPHIKEVIITSKNYNQFLQDANSKKVKLAIIYKLIDDDGKQTIKDLVENGSMLYPSSFLFVNVDYKQLEPSNPLNLLEEMFIRMQMDKQPTKKPLFVTQKKGIDEVLLVAEKVLLDINIYTDHSYKV